MTRKNYSDKIKNGTDLVEAYQLGANLTALIAAEEVAALFAEEGTVADEGSLIQRAERISRKVDLLGRDIDLSGYKLDLYNLGLLGYEMKGKRISVESLVAKPRPIQLDPTLPGGSKGNLEWFIEGTIPPPKHFTGRIFEANPTTPFMRVEPGRPLSFLFSRLAIRMVDDEGLPLVHVDFIGKE